MKMLHLTLSLLLAQSFALTQAQVVFSTVYGYADVTVEAATDETLSRLTVISSTFLKNVEFHGTATINANFSNNTQTLTFGTETWTANQFTEDPHLAYLTNSNGAEEAFLITSHTTNGTITVNTTFNLNSPPAGIAGYPAAAEVKIRKANTIGTLFGAQQSSFNQNDSIFLWNGAWTQYFFDGSKWRQAGDPFSDQIDTVVYPEEGILVKRTQTTPLTFRFYGEVPSKVQTASFNTGGLQLISNRYPLAGTLAQQNFTDLAGWNNQTDSIYMWLNNSWTRFNYNGSYWHIQGDPFTNAGNTLVNANTAIFISRNSASNTQTNQELPYDPTVE